MATTALFLSTCLVVAVGRRPNTKAQRELRRETPPYWAYAVNPPEEPRDERANSKDKTPQRVPGSSSTFTLKEVADMFSVPDWRPYRHPPMPEIVASGRRPEVFACGYCHLPNGQGRPENASLAGLPVAHIIQQMADFRSGLRKSSDPKHKPVMAMIAYETKTHVAGWMPVASRPGGMEPIGRRIIEMPENLERAELRDDASGFVAYVPAGSIQKGKALVTGGRNEKTVACDTCHGADLQGLRDGPSIAGRSSSYIVRQLFDIQGGARAGAKTQWMNSLVEKLSLDELISIAAYAASLRP